MPRLSPPGLERPEEWLASPSPATVRDWLARRSEACSVTARILAIDPGSSLSAWLLLVNGKPERFAKVPNDELRDMLRWSLDSLPGTDATVVADVVVIEKVESFGMAVGAEVFETVYWSGRFAEAAHPLQVERLGRKAVKLALCGTTRAKDANVWAALLDRFGGSSAVGRKAAPGPLYGIHSDVRAALAVAVAWSDGARS